MNERTLRAYRHTRVKSDPAVWGSKPTYVRDKAFMCGFRATTTQEALRAGRDTSNRYARFFYDQREVSFSYGDLVEFNSQKWEVIYVPSATYITDNYVDVRLMENA